MSYKKNRYDLNLSLSDLKNFQDIPSDRLYRICLPEELNNLPCELLDELSFLNFDDVLVSIIKQAGGICSIDRILIILYNTFNKIYKRESINSRLYRMIQKGKLFYVPNKNCFYSINKIEDE